MQGVLKSEVLVAPPPKNWVQLGGNWLFIIGKGHHYLDGRVRYGMQWVPQVSEGGSNGVGVQVEGRLVLRA